MAGKHSRPPWPTDSLGVLLCGRSYQQVDMLVGLRAAGTMHCLDADTGEVLPRAVGRGPLEAWLPGPQSATQNASAAA